MQNFSFCAVIAYYEDYSFLQDNMASYLILLVTKDTDVKSFNNVTKVMNITLA